MGQGRWQDTASPDVSALPVRPTLLNRRVHHWLSLVVALPLLIVIPTGVLLQVKKLSTWVQPAEQRGTGVPAVSMTTLLDTLRARPDLGVASWDDVARIDVRPSKQLVKVTLGGRREVQMDAATGRVLQVAVRRSDLIEELHDGSFFGEGVRYGLFLVSGIALFALWATGLVLFVHPYWAKMRKRQRRAAAHRPR